MSDKKSYLYDSFQMFYEQGKTAEKGKQYKSASRSYLYAAESLLKLAMESEGELKKARYEHAIRLQELSNQMKNYDKAMDGMSNQHIETSSIEMGKHKVNQKSLSEGDTETLWKSSDIPNVTFDDVAGLDDVKKSVEMRIVLPLRHRGIFDQFKKKIGGGILLYGPPGTGKSMIAQAIAHEVQAKFYSVKTSDIVSKWFGEAEKNIKNLFAEARTNERAIIFFDEFEALGTKRGGNSTVMNRIVPELLAQIQGFTQNDSMLLLLAATNRPWDVDSALLRPGRFHELIYVSLPDYEARKAIFTRLLSGIPIEDEVDIEYLSSVTNNYSGADISEFCDRLKTEPILRSIKTGIVDGINNKDVEKVLQKLNPSVQLEDLKKFDQFIKKSI